MAEIGKEATLTVVRIGEIGAYLDGENLGEILLPKRYVDDALVEGDDIVVFIYLDSEDRLVATTETPLARVGEFAMLKVVDVNKTGAFLDWGLRKDLLVPFREQARRMEKGRYYLVYLFLDNRTERIVASSKLEKFVRDESRGLRENQVVDVLVAKKTDVGFKAIVEDRYWGLLYNNEIFRPLKVGDRVRAVIKKVRADQRIDLRLHESSSAKRNELSDRILDEVERNGGYLPLSDRSSPEAIKQHFGVSKRVFKQTLGNLYKQEKIVIEQDGIRLADN